MIRAILVTCVLAASGVRAAAPAKAPPGTAPAPRKGAKPAPVKGQKPAKPKAHRRAEAKQFLQDAARTAKPATKKEISAIIALVDAKKFDQANTRVGELKRNAALTGESSAT